MSVLYKKSIEGKDGKERHQIHQKRVGETVQNKGTDYIRRILRDKARQKRWRRIMLCLSCIVVFCTIYVLILPAITLEKKTTCEEEQSAIQEEQPLVQEEDESIVQSDDSDEVEFVSCEPIEEETDDIEDVEITEDPEEEMDVDFASGEEDGIAVADETVMPEGGITEGFDLSAEEAAEKRVYVKLSYKKEDGTWQEFSQDIMLRRYLETLQSNWRLNIRTCRSVIY